MLNNLDTVISFAVVMLGISLLITVITQTFSTVVNLRGLQLRRGLTVLFKESGLAASATAAIAEAALKHPLVADGIWMRRLTPAIGKTELFGVLKRLSEESGTENQAVKEALAKLQEAVPSIDAWFDATMARASHWFAGYMRIATIVASLVMALALHLDALALIRQLSGDSELRASLQATSNVVLARATQTLTPPAGGTPADSTTVESLVRQAGLIRSDLAKTGFHLVPEPYPGFHYDLASSHFWGVLAAAVLLSLGAPFWFNLLKTASNLRPAIANSVDQKQAAENAGQGGA